MKTSFIDGPNLAAKLNHLLSNCSGLDVAMAYVKIGGLEPFLNSMNKSNLVKDGKQVRIVFGLSSRQGITDKDSAKMLLRFAEQNKNVTVKKYDNSRFHPKLMIFYGNPDRILVGSSNLTIGAQSVNAEANVIIEKPCNKFRNDAISFFQKYFDKAKVLEKEHVDSYNPPSHSTKGGGKRKPEDKLPFSPTTYKPLVEGTEKHGAGNPIKPKSYYDEKIKNLERKKELNKKERRSLGAYRALRTRYFGKIGGNSKVKGILVPVTKGKDHLKDIAEMKEGIWTIGRGISENRSSTATVIYFYENNAKRARYKGKIDKVQNASSGQIRISRIERLRNSRELSSFKKSNGEYVRALQSFAYVIN